MEEVDMNEEAEEEERKNALGGEQEVCTLVFIGGPGVRPRKVSLQVASNGYFIHNTGTLWVQMTHIWV